MYRLAARKALREMHDLSDSNTIYKSLRPKQVVNSVLRVTKFVNVVENQYINALGLGVEVLNQVDKRKGLPEDFNKNRIFNTNTKFHKDIREIVQKMVLITMTGFFCK